MPEHDSIPNFDESSPETNSASSTPETTPEDLVEARLAEVMKADEEVVHLKEQLDRLSDPRYAGSSSVETKREALQTQFFQRREQLTEQVQQELGLTNPDDKTKQELERQERLLKLATELSTDHPETEVLQKLGLLNEEGRFQFTTQLFSLDTVKLWNRYIDNVKRSNTLLEHSQDFHVEPVDMQRIDRKRTQVHDEVTHAIMHDLRMEDSEANFMITRSLVAKMRDLRIPNQGEAQTTAKAAFNLLMTLREEQEAA